MRLSKFMRPVAVSFSLRCSTEQLTLLRSSFSLFLATHPSHHPEKLACYANLYFWRTRDSGLVSVIDSAISLIFGIAYFTRGAFFCHILKSSSSVDFEAIL